MGICVLATFISEIMKGKFSALQALVLFVLQFGLAPKLVAEEGMWPPPLINAAILEQMKAKGFALTPEQLYSTSQPSLKDAIVLFGRGCTAEIISNQGLLLTNHHCGYDQIQSHSSLQHDYLQDGFWAKNQAEELPNPGLTVSILVKMEDVTSQVLEGVSPGISDKERQSLIEGNARKIKDKAIGGTHYEAQIRPFFGGLQQWLLVYETFTDIRLVGAPPSSIGKFGGDTDNWVWPRHTGDFSMFRIYAGKGNKPAPYSAENQPYTPKKYLPISTTGIKEGDFTMLLGYPGRTNEYVSSFALEVITQVSNPKKIALRTSRLNVINAAMKASDADRIKYASNQADIANAWKKMQGELLGMAKADAIGAKKRMETRYRQFYAAKGPEGKPFLDALDQLESLSGKIRNSILPFEYQREAIMSNTIFSLATVTKNLAPPKDVKLDETVKTKKLTDFKAIAREIWKDSNPLVERKLFSVTLKAYITDIPATQLSTTLVERIKRYPFEGEKFETEFFDKGNWFDSSAVYKLATRVLEGDMKSLEKNSTYSLLSDVVGHYNQVTLPNYQHLKSQEEIAQQTFLRGQMLMEPTRAFYPDANQTFRMAFGQVSSYDPADGVSYKWQTTTLGILEKANTEYDFMMSSELKDTYIRQNTSPQGPVPVAFIASNHSTGGNSGSPVLNARGELIGVNFDRVWEGTMSDYYFDSRICRNITADIRYILWVVTHVGKSDHLVKEMTLIK